jgi:cytochrome c oxidase assembly protein subunit 15
LLRGLGEARDGALLSFESLVAVHMAHRLFALLAIAALLGLAWRLWLAPDAALRRHGAGLAALTVLQFASGLSNVVLGWPLVAALGHSAGAAGMVLLLTLLLARSALGRAVDATPRPLAAAA